MTIQQRIISEIYDTKEDKVLKRTIIKKKDIVNPKSIDEVGYNQEEQIDTLKSMQDEYFEKMSKIIGDSRCRRCGGDTKKLGKIACDFHSVYTDHKIIIPRRLCLNCGTKYNDTIHSLFGNSMHPDLMKKQAEIGSTNSYRKAERILEKESGTKRTINNLYSVKKVVDKVGVALDEIHKTSFSVEEKIKPAGHLVVQTDGGYVKDKNPRMKNFEVLITKIYNINDHVKGYVDDNGNRKSGIIHDKIYAASALKDRGKSIRQMTKVASQRQGMTKDTTVTAISDGAKNCWNVLKSLEISYKNIEYILDWYHIKDKFQKLLNKTEDPYAQEIESIQWKIWHGESGDALKRLAILYTETVDTEYTDKVHDLLKYLTSNKRYLINYAEKHDQQLPYTSTIIESSVEHIINERHKKKQKAQWTRHGAHNVLQIRTSEASGNWDEEWEKAKQKIYHLPKAS